MGAGPEGFFPGGSNSESFKVVYFSRGGNSGAILFYQLKTKGETLLN